MNHLSKQRLAFGTFLLGAFLVAGPTACASSGPPPDDRHVASPNCASYKVGEVRDAYRSEIDRIRRRMGGDFVVVRSDSPGSRSRTPEGNPVTYTVEVYRYEDSRCARQRRR